MKTCKSCGARYTDDAKRCPLDGGSLVAAPDPLVGRTIAGRYRLTKQIGAGGMGTVYRAYHGAGQRDVAIKFLSPDLAADETNRLRFLREARAASRIQHEHIIEVTDWGQTADGLTYMVMEYLEGRGLDAVVQDGPMAARRALRLALQVARALARAHDFDVVHRDIKPENIILLENAEGDYAKILDFGLARIRGEMKLTATGTVFGTPEYMAPEQLRGQATPGVDLYALGVVLYELLAGQLPFSGHMHEVLRRHLTEKPRPPSSHVSSVPKAVDEIVLRLLEKDPVDRYQNAHAVVDAIEGVLEELSAGRRSAPPAIRPSAPPAAPPILAPEKEWLEQLAHYRRRLRDVGSSAPPWLPKNLGRIEDRLHAIERLRAELGMQDSATTARQRDVRTIQARLGRAVDELGKDSAVLVAEMASLERDHETAADECLDLEARLLKLWAQLGPTPSPRERGSLRESAKRLEEAGELARRWRARQERVDSLVREIAERTRKLADLTAQIQEIKRRLEEESDAGGKLDTLRNEVSALDQMIDRELLEVAKEVDPIARYFDGEGSEDDTPIDPGSGNDGR